MSGRKRIALVLAGGAARGAYEVGVVDYILHDLPRELGRDPRFDIYCGTSVGALNVCALAAMADDPRGRSTRLADIWSSLKIDHVVRPDGAELLSMLKNIFGRSVAVDRHKGGIFHPGGLHRLVQGQIPFERIDDQIASGRVEALTVSATHVGTGKTVVFVQRGSTSTEPLWAEPTVIARPVHIRGRHALASAAIPFLFPSVTIDGDYYCDGGLRQNVPLSPARRLGADALVVINPRFVPPPAPGLERPQHEPYPGPLFLLGKTLNALLLDRLDNDLDRLRHINQILEAGVKRYGPTFVHELNVALGRPPGKGLKPLRTVLIRASQDIGRHAAEFVRSPRFTSRTGGMIARVMRRLAEGENPRQADFLSYLLFDGEFSRELIELGRSDARARKEELLSLFEDMLDARAA